MVSRSCRWISGGKLQMNVLLACTLSAFLSMPLSLCLSLSASLSPSISIPLSLPISLPLFLPLSLSASLSLSDQVIVHHKHENVYQFLCSCRLRTALPECGGVHVPCYPSVNNPDVQHYLIERPLRPHIPIFQTVWFLKSTG